MQFTKPPLSFTAQVDRLFERGMEIHDRERAERYLAHLNYYRLAAYWLPFEQNHADHTFRPGTKFDVVLDHYVFDRELRLLVMDAIERIEVSLRTGWAYILSHSYGPHAHLKRSIFKARWPYDKNIRMLEKNVRQSSEVFIRHFRDQYDERLPPVWVICEIMTIGQLSQWYANLKHGRDRNAIARRYGLDEVNLASFLHHLSVVRNHCAHHSRLWNRSFAISWKLPRKKPAGLFDNFNHEDGKRIYNTLVMLAYLMDRINPNTWKIRLNSLFAKYSVVNPRIMGFPENWQDRPIWKQQY
ncbi:Abi family protein [Thermodesulfobacteriota bacterium B35]